MANAGAAMFKTLNTAKHSYMWTLAYNINWWHLVMVDNVFRQIQSVKTFLIIDMGIL
jgi:hypothetical protein